MKTKTAFLISEVCAPWVTNLWFFLVLGATSHAWPAAITAILGTSIMPMAAIRVLTLIGKAEGRHVQKREQRYIVFAAIFVLLGAALALKGHSWGEVGVGVIAGAAVTAVSYQLFLT